MGKTNHSFNRQQKRYVKGVCGGRSVPCENLFLKEEKKPNTDDDTTSSTSTYPWSGGSLNSFWYWEGNYTSATGNQGWYTGVSAPQSANLSTSNLIPTTTGTFTYYYSSSKFQFPSNLNSINLFIGYANANLGLGQYYAYNYTTGTSMLQDAYTYFNITDISDATTNNKLIGMSFGGGNSSTGGWTTGEPTAAANANPTDNPTVGGIYSIYQNCTPSGVSFSYTETGTGNTLTGTGTCSGYTNLTSGPTKNGVNASGLYSLTQFNCLVFDIEDGNTVSGYSTSTGEDFLNLFQYIKTNKNSVFYTTGVIIIVTISHSCSENIGSGVIAPILSANPCYYDYVSPQLYTCNIGTTNEYCANWQIPWSPAWTSSGSSYPSFTSLLQQNGNYSKYGLNMIIPSINYSNLYTSAGTNPSPYYPNLYWFETDYSSQASPPAPTSDSSSAGTITYSSDNGAVSFFNTMFNSSSNQLGGYIEWVNGSVGGD